MKDKSNTDVYTAWQALINEKTVADDRVRTDIVQSWLRSKLVDPFSKHHHQLPNRLLQSKLAENVHLISLARPVIKELSEIEGLDFAALSDPDAYIVDIAGKSEYYELLGLRYQEQDVGTNAIGTALALDRPFEVKGSEHYRQVYHTTSGAAVPVHNRESIVGVLAAYCMTGPLPAGIIQALKLGVKVIENQFQYKSEQSQITHIYHNTCSSIIDFFHDGFFVVDAQDNLINVNQSCCQMLGVADRESLIGEYLGNLLADDNSVLANLLSSDPNQFVSKFSLKGPAGIIPCSLVRRRITRNPDGSQQTVLGFVVEGKDVDPQKHSAFSGAYGEDASSIDNLIGHSEKWNEIKKLVLRAARVSSSVLIEGESGTGKELVARAIHEESGLKGPFVAINCGAIPKELLQSELFGYEEGAFTGARKGGGIGKLELGDGGTVFLDEIGEMPFDMQVNLLRFLQDKMVTRIGSSVSKKVDVRIIAATNRRLKNEVTMGRFREDLYYRLNVIGIELPPLRERELDIPPITRYFIQTICRQFKRDVVSISDAAMHMLCAYRWPGNVRELRNVIENAIVFTEGNVITEDLLPSYLRENLTVPLPPIPEIRDAAVPNDQELHGLTIEEARKRNQKIAAEQERNEILQLLDQYGGNVSQVARHMGTSRNTIYRKMKNYKIEV
ncbi:MAG: sigma 54-interacting transcriptional regulator [Syntrophomonadaceae bacterium]